MIKLGLDVHIASIVAVMQEGTLPPKPARRLSREQLLALVRQQVERGAAVHCVQESCGFGFVLHRELVDAGAKSMLITPIRLDEARRGRKTDRQDARALCLRLSRYLDGHHDELRPIRIPTIEEERRRELSRRREFIQRQIRRLDNRGRAVLLEHRYQSLPAGWARPPADFPIPIRLLGGGHANGKRRRLCSMSGCSAGLGRIISSLQSHRALLAVWIIKAQRIFLCVCYHPRVTQVCP